MRNLALLLVIVLSATGCATGRVDKTNKESFAERSRRFHRLAMEQAPATWRSGASWTFVSLDKHGELEDSIIFEITDEPAKTCISGDWKKLKVLRQGTSKTSEPAYSREGRNLQILLSTALCDAYNEFSGTLDERGFSGRHTFSGLTGGEEHGKVYGVPSDNY